MFLAMSAVNPRRSSNSDITKYITVESDSRAVEIDSQRRTERQLKGLILPLTRWVDVSAEFIWFKVE